MLVLKNVRNTVEKELVRDSNSQNVNTCKVFIYKKSEFFSGFFIGKNTFTFSANSGADIIQGFDGNDKIIFSGASDLTYYKKGNSNDLVITKNDEEDKLTLKNFFGVDEDKRIKLQDENIDKIFIAGSVRIYGVFCYTCICGVKIQTEYWIDAVTEKVSGWLSSYADGKYADKTAFDVISEGTDKDITALLKVYQSVDNGITFER